MLKKLLVCIAVGAFAAGTLTGCAKSRCKDICEWWDDCIEDIDNDACVEECTEDYDDSGCKDAIKALDDCIDDRGCAASADACWGEFTDFANEC